MSSDHNELLSQAVAGDQLALQRLLIPFQSRLLARIRRKLPVSLSRVIAAEDVLQEAYVDVFRAIGGFQRQGDGAFYRWLLTIADNRVIDMIRAHQAAKRGGGRLG